MKIVFVADINSPLARNWISYFVEQGDQVEVISHYPVLAGVGFNVPVHVLPLAISWAYAFSASGMALRRQSKAHIHPLKRWMSSALRGVNGRFDLQRILYGYLGPWEAKRLTTRVQQIIDTIRPDIVHGMRIPMEGQSLFRVEGAPIVLSVWGNDLTLWAAHYGGHRHLTKLALQRANGLHADCQRDIQLARQLGYEVEKPILVSPSGGGIRFNSSVDTHLVEEWRQRLALEAQTPVVLNPRGIRAYIKTKEYIHAIPEVLRVFPNTIFVSVGVQDDPLVMNLVKELRITTSVRLLPTVSQADLAAIFHLAMIMVSPSVHDGTPNTLLEGMAYGVMPVAGDLESIREWIRPEENGLLFDPSAPDKIAAAIISALRNAELRSQARRINLDLVRERAVYHRCMGKARDFYQQIAIDWQRSRDSAI